jgi:hypothetical protein
MRRMLKTVRLCAFGAAAGLSIARPAAAHAFGARYDLPVPLSLYLVGAGIAVALSFVVAAAFLGGRADSSRRSSFNLFNWRLVRLLGGSGPRAVVKFASAALFVLVIAAGLFGNQDPYGNLAPTIMWIIWWVGMAYVCALFGNLWALVNPWNVLFEGADRLYGAVQPGRRLGFGLAYPSWLGVWLACLLFLAFAWAELVWPARVEPSSLAIIILIYSAITWAGMLLFGRAAWLAGGEPSSVAFGLISRFAPLDAQSAHELNLRPPAAGLIADPPASPSADRVRAPSPRHRHLRRLQGNACLGIARGRIDGPWTARSPPGDAGITDLSTAVLGVVSRHLLVDVAHRRQRPHDGGYGGAFRYHSGANRHRLPSGALSFVPADQRPIDDTAGFRPVRLRLGPVRHGRLPRRYRRGRRKVRLVHGACGDRCRAYSCRGAPHPWR